MTIAVVIPCRETEDAYITLYSLCRQSVLPNEVHVIYDQGNGANWARNRGFETVKTKYVLLNNDTEVTDNWLLRLHEPFLANPFIGAVGPLTTSPNCWQGKAKADVGFKILKSSAMLAFFCVMFKREVIEKVGLLDEDFGVGLADDDEYCYRIHKAGFRLALAHNLRIVHHHRSTFNELYTPQEVEDLIQKGLKLFYEKHPEAT